MKTVKSTCISDFKYYFNNYNGRLHHTCYVRIYIQKCTWPKSDTQQAVWMSHAAAWFVMALSWQFITVMYPVALMNNEESMIQDKEKSPCYTSTTSWMRILYLGFVEDAGLLITVFIGCRYLMISKPRKTSQSSARMKCFCCIIMSIIT